MESKVCATNNPIVLVSMLDTHRSSLLFQITFKNLTGEYQFSGWSLDGKGIYITEFNGRVSTALYAGLDGHSQVFWKRGSSPGFELVHAIPSPDGRYLAFTVINYKANAWMLENF